MAIAHINIDGLDCLLSQAADHLITMENTAPMLLPNWLTGHFFFLKAAAGPLHQHQLEISELECETRNGERG